ncbi:ABC transporter permease [Paenibacillus marinisediminis]
MKPAELALRRWRHHMNFQWKTASTVLDWTVMLYFIVPALLLGGKFYADWWLKPLEVPSMLQEMQLWVYLFLLPIFWSRLRTWQEAGDILFLRQLPAWWRSFIRFGIVEMMLRQALIVLLLTLAALPWMLKAFGISSAVVISTAFLAWLWSCLKAMAVNQIQVRFHGWPMKIASSLTVMLAIVIFRLLLVPAGETILGATAATILLAGALIPCCIWRMRAAYTFERDIDIEIDYKMRLTNLLLSQAVEKPPRRRKGKRPLLFRKSGYLMETKTSGITIGAIAVKTLWRSGAHISFYLQLTGVGAVAIMISTLKAPALLYLVLPVMGVVLGYWLNSYWREVLSSEAWSIYVFSVADLHAGAVHFIRINAVVPAIIWSFSAAVWMPAVSDKLLVFAVGIAVTIWVCARVMKMRGWKVKETIELG